MTDKIQVQVVKKIFDTHIDGDVNAVEVFLSPIGTVGGTPDASYGSIPSSDKVASFRIPPNTLKQVDDHISNLMQKYDVVGGVLETKTSLLVPSPPQEGTIKRAMIPDSPMAQRDLRTDPSPEKKRNTPSRYELYTKEKTKTYDERIKSW